jgi:hypothetical protein
MENDVEVLFQSSASTISPEQTKELIEEAKRFWLSPDGKKAIKESRLLQTYANK